MRVKIEATFERGNILLEKYPILKKYEPQLKNEYYNFKDKSFFKELTIEIAPEDIFKLVKELNENIIIFAPKYDEAIELEIYDDYRE